MEFPPIREPLTHPQVWVHHLPGGLIPHRGPNQSAEGVLALVTAGNEWGRAAFWPVTIALFLRCVCRRYWRKFALRIRIRIFFFSYFFGCQSCQKTPETYNTRTRRRRFLLRLLLRTMGQNQDLVFKQLHYLRRMWFCLRKPTVFNDIIK